MPLLHSNAVLPLIRSLSDCANFERTVAPYTSQLVVFSGEAARTVTSPQEFKTLYLATNPVISAFAFSLFLSPIFLLISEVNKNYSQVDRVWSILPTIYILHYDIWARMSGMPTPRLDTLLACSCIWSLRLTFNYWRKGGYSIGSEDYRWAVLREKINAPLFFVFNVLFISLWQSILLFVVTTPTYPLLLASRVTRAQMSTTDIMFSGIMVGLVLVEFLADEQQWRFQNAKKQYQQTAKVPPNSDKADLDRGFITSGLWRYSRHPNFACEMAVWITLYQWSCSATDTYYNWTLAGPVAYVGLFQASTLFTEWITAGKYPEYRRYQTEVGKFLPSLTSRASGG